MSEINNPATSPKLAELYSKADDLTKQYNATVLEGTMADAAKVEADLDQAINEYTAEVRKMCFDACKATDDPMLTACTLRTFVTIKRKDQKEQGDNSGRPPVRTLEQCEKDIDLYKLHKYIEGGVGHDKNWVHIAEKFNMLLTAAAAKDLGLDPKAVSDSYAMSQIARDIDLGKAPTSDTAILAQLKVVIAAMIGDGYKVTTHDVKYLLKVYTKKTKKALTVTTANHRYMRGYLADICHKLVTGKVYGIDYKTVKDK